MHNNNRRFGVTSVGSRSAKPVQWWIALAGLLVMGLCGTGCTARMYDEPSYPTQYSTQYSTQTRTHRLHGAHAAPTHGKHAGSHHRGRHHSAAEDPTNGHARPSNDAVGRDSERPAARPSLESHSSKAPSNRAEASRANTGRKFRTTDNDGHRMRPQHSAGPRKAGAHSRSVDAPDSVSLRPAARPSGGHSTANSSSDGSSSKQHASPTQSKNSSGKKSVASGKKSSSKGANDREGRR